MAINLNLLKKPGLFITGTDSAVGKTLVAGAIAKILSDDGLKVGVFKPVAAGCTYGWEGLASNDARFLAGCANSSLPLSMINPVSYVTAAVPVVCAEREGKPVGFERIAVAYSRVCEGSDIVIVEGIGGARVPLDEQFDLLDLAVELGLPAVIVTHPEAGTVNHALMTIDCIRAAKLSIAGVVVNCCDVTKETVAGNTAGAVIRQFGGVEILAEVPFDEMVDIAKTEPGETAVASLGSCNWRQLAGLKT
jgi:dethiobiotin synthetase